MMKKRVAYSTFKKIMVRHENRLRKKYPFQSPASYLITAHTLASRKYSIRKPKHQRNPFFFQKPPNYRESTHQYNQNQSMFRRAWNMMK